MNIITMKACTVCKSCIVVSILWTSYLRRNININRLLFLKALPNLYRKPHLNSVFGLSFLVIGRFSPVPALIGCSKKILLDLNVIGSIFRNYFQDHRRASGTAFFRVVDSFKNAATSSVKRVKNHHSTNREYGFNI
jgi:hypothetical protein